VFTAIVEGETILNTMWGSKAIAWRAEPGTPCIILGYWEDGTVHLRWAAIGGHYRVDGRFPGWVVTPDPDAKMAGGGRILRANTPISSGRRLPVSALIAVIVVVVGLVLLAVLLYGTR
jgi:hypothetical protein